MTMDRKLVRVQEKGQVTLPADLRRKSGLKKGDLVATDPAAGPWLLQASRTERSHHPSLPLAGAVRC